MQVVIAITLIVFAAALRLAPHAPNFAPVAAIALFSGAVLPRRLALVVPLMAMLAADAVIGFYQWPVMASVYGSFLAVVLAGFLVKRGGRRPSDVALASLSGSVFFFLVTNFAVWRWGGLYPATADGLVRCYDMAVPFFRNTLAGDLFYNTAIFGLYAVAWWAAKNRAWLRDRQMLRSPHG
jgi:hypothetical protein